MNDLRPPVALRPVREDDRAFLVSLFASTREPELALLPVDRAGRERFIAGQFAAQGKQLAHAHPNAADDVVLVDGERAGRLIVDRSGPEVVVADIALIPAHRGRGIGTSLLREILDEAGGLGRPVSLQVSRSNVRALGLYRRLGFTDTGGDAMYAHLRRGPRTVTRRRLVQAGVAGSAVLGLAQLGQLEALAKAAVGGPSPFTRSSFEELSPPRLTVRAAAGKRTLDVVSVDDVAAAATIPGLRGRDDVFSIRLRGTGEPLASAIHPLEHSDLGRFSAFVTPVGEPAAQEYELLVDRSVPVPGVVTGTPPPGAAPERPQPPAARLLGASIRRGRGPSLVVEARLDSSVEIARASLLRGGRAVGRVVERPRGGALRLRFKTRQPAPSGRYVLRLELGYAARDESTVRKSLRLR